MEIVHSNDLGDCFRNVGYETHVLDRDRDMGELHLWILVFMIRFRRECGRIYTWLLILYGGTRFVLNYFRETTPFILNIPSGHVWSLVSVVVGFILLFALKEKKQVNG